MRNHASGVALALWVALSGAARAEMVTEPATGQSFDAHRTVDGKPYLLVGTGVRKKIGFKVYAMALYVDEAEARRAFPALATRAGGRDRAHVTASDHAQSFVMWGGFGKLAVLHFVRSVEAPKIQEAFREGLEEELSDKASADRKAAAEAFLALFATDMKDGGEIVIATSAAGKITANVAGQGKDGPTSPRLARAAWGIWLGAKPISTDLRRSLVERVDLLGAP